MMLAKLCLVASLRKIVFISRLTEGWPTRLEDTRPRGDLYQRENRKLYGRPVWSDR
jgi:hypothetical protein